MTQATTTHTHQGYLTSQIVCIRAGLEPNTSYRLRLTAYNAHGPSPRTVLVLTTASKQPPQPIVIKSGPTMVTLSWNVSTAFKRRMKELEEVFRRADVDNSGQLDRAELLTALRKDRYEVEEEEEQRDGRGHAN